MIGLMQLETDGSLFRMSWTDEPWDNREHLHITPAAPILRCYNEVLVPLATARGDELTKEEVHAAVEGTAIAGWFPAKKVDWLGLALYSEHRFLEAMGKLATANTPEHQAEILASSPLMWLLPKLYVHSCWEHAPEGAP